LHFFFLFSGLGIKQKGITIFKEGKRGKKKGFASSL